VENITPSWQKLAAWRAESSYEMSPRQWLEEHLGPRPFSVTETDLEMDLYLSINET
jgi:DNA gyrase inhibitor GyrI